MVMATLSPSLATRGTLPIECMLSWWSGVRWMCARKVVVG